MVKIKELIKYFEKEIELNKFDPSNTSMSLYSVGKIDKIEISQVLDKININLYASANNIYSGIKLDTLLSTLNAFNDIEDELLNINIIDETDKYNTSKYSYIGGIEFVKYDNIEKFFSDDYDELDYVEYEVVFSY